MNNENNNTSALGKLADVGLSIEITWMSGLVLAVTCLVIFATFFTLKKYVK